MTKVIWRLAAGFNGLMIDSEAPGVGPAMQPHLLKGRNRYEARGDRKVNKLVIVPTNNATSGHRGGVGGAVDALYVINQVANNHVANSAETAAMNALIPSVLQMMPPRYGGVLVVASFRKTGPAINFLKSYIHGAYPTMKHGVEAYHGKGSITSQDMVVRLWWAITDKKDDPHVGQPVMRSWP